MNETALLFIEEKGRDTLPTFLGRNLEGILDQFLQAQGKSWRKALELRWFARGSCMTEWLERRPERVSQS